MRFPAPYYFALALSVDVAYFLSMADGGYGTMLTAHVPDVVAVTQKAVCCAAESKAASSWAKSDGSSSSISGSGGAHVLPVSPNIAP